MELSVRAGWHLDEDRLLRAGRRGDHQAIETLFRRYQRRLFRTALRVLGNAADAEDVLQDAMLSAYRALAHFEGRSQFSSWLTRIVINAALMRKRTQRGRATESSPDRGSPTRSRPNPTSRTGCRLCPQPA